jgi:hypothetical protein
MGLPESLSINAWCGEPVSGALGESAENWGVKAQRETPRKIMVAEEPAELWDWENPDVGWGIVLPENEDVSPAIRATAQDAPAPIQSLVEERGNAPVFRYRADLLNRKVRRYLADGSARDLDITDSKRGIGDKKLPRYLLIYASPAEIPWSFQYVLGQSAFVGRLDLDGDGLENYVTALIDGWASANCRADQPVVWAVDHGHPDITWLMDGAIAKPIAAKLQQDGDIGDKVHQISGSAATIDGLHGELKSRCPALVITTSHGMTGPLNDAGRMRRNLGLLVDDQHRLLQPAGLLDDWEPDGAIWYSHACCSAGSDATTSYKGLVETGSKVDRVLNAVAALGAQVAPFPRGLLGASKPLRAFIGQVEPTFDWTLRAETGQVLTNSLCEALYTRMHQKKPQPVGMAFHEVHLHAGQLFSQLDSLRRDIVRAVAGAKEAAIRTHLAALDRQSMVILGDPTVALPPLVP